MGIRDAKGAWHRFFFEARLGQSTWCGERGVKHTSPGLTPGPSQLLQAPPRWGRGGCECLWETQGGRAPGPLNPLSGTLLQESDQCYPKLPRPHEGLLREESRKSLSKTPLTVSWKAWSYQGKGLVLHQPHWGKIRVKEQWDSGVLSQKPLWFVQPTESRSPLSQGISQENPVWLLVICEEKMEKLDTNIPTP